MVERGEPQLGTGINQRSELDASLHRPIIESASPALRASQGLEPQLLAATGLERTYGRSAVPTFFWGGETTTAGRQHSGA